MITPWSGVLHKLIAVQLIKETELENCLLCSQESAISPYPDSDQFNLLHHV
jgi:hypothetical protein